MAAAAATGLKASAMRAAERGRALSPPLRSRAYAAPWSGPSSSGAVLGLSAGGQAPAERSLSPAPSCSGSTLSLLSPLGRPGFPFDGEDGEDSGAKDGGAEDREAAQAPGHGREAEAESEAEAGEALAARVAGSLTPWELWFVGKEKEERERLQQRALEELSRQIEKRKQMAELEKRKVISQEKHRAWVRRKKEQKRKETEEKISKEMEERAAKELEKQHLQEKAKEKYEEWLQRKHAEDREKQQRAKEKEKQRQAELLEKKEIAERKFKEWLENAKNKPRPSAKSYGFANGRLTGFYSGNSYPEPAFYNPIPWKPIHAPPPHAARGLLGKKSRQLAGPRLLPAVSPSSSLAARGARTGLGLGTVCRARR